MKIKHAHEAPISIFKDVQRLTDYDYALVHLFEKNQEYLKCFEDAVSSGREVILDNSIFELKKAFNADSFAKWVEHLKPEWYIIPDVLEDSDATIENARNWLSKYKNLPGKKIGVVQGKTYDDIVNCYEFMCDHVDKIAISFDYSFYNNMLIDSKYILQEIDSKKIQLIKQYTGRQALINQMIEDYIWNTSIPVHLLGASLVREFSYYVENEIHNIDSVDTSSPVMCGIQAVPYDFQFGNSNKPSGLMADIINCVLSPAQKQNIENNINIFKGIIS